MVYLFRAVVVGVFSLLMCGLAISGSHPGHKQLSSTGKTHALQELQKCKEIFNSPAFSNKSVCSAYTHGKLLPVSYSYHTKSCTINFVNCSLSGQTELKRYSFNYSPSDAKYMQFCGSGLNVYFAASCN